MPRLIDADKLHFDLALDGAGHEIRFIEANDIHEAPTIDAVLVVRCDKCKYHYDDGYHKCRKLHICCPSSDFFCKYGEVIEK